MRTLEARSAHVCCYMTHYHMSYSLKHMHMQALTALSVPLQFIQFF